MTGEFPTQRASNAENVSIWWRHHGNISFGTLAPLLKANVIVIDPMQLVYKKADIYIVMHLHHAEPHP